MKTWFIKNKSLLALVAFFLIITFYLSFFGFQKGTDDEWFKRISYQQNYFDYLSNRYMTWSARIFPDSIMYIIFSFPMLVYWSITSFALFLTSYSIARFFKKDVRNFDIFLVCIFLGFMNFEVIFHSFLWMTGAVNYLWPLALGLFSMIAYADFVLRNYKWSNNRWIVASILATILFSISNEQYLVVGLAAALISHIVLFFKKKKQFIFLSIKTLVMFLGFLIMYFSPGNEIRLQKETEKWYPDFSELSIFSHVKVGLNFMVTGIYNNIFSIFLLVVLSSLLLLKLNNFSYILTSLVIICLACMYLFPGYSSALSQIYNYSARELFTISAFSVVMKNFFVAILLLILVMIAVYQSASYKIFSLLCMAAALLSIVMLWFSPTLFASGSRVFVCAGILFIIVAYDLVDKKIDTTPIPKNVLLILLAIYPVLNLTLPLILGTVSKA